MIKYVSRTGWLTLILLGCTLVQPWAQYAHAEQEPPALVKTPNITTDAASTTAPTHTMWSQDTNLVGQALRMILALLLVIALIYLVAKFGLSRLTHLRVGLGGKHIKIVERVPLDQQHTLYLLELEPNAERIIVGTSPHGMHQINSRPPPRPAFDGFLSPSPQHSNTDHNGETHA